MLQLFACVLAVTLAAEPQGQSIPVPPGAANAAATTAGTSTLRGHVFAADTGLPLRKAQVRIFAPEIRESRMATTDTEGKFEFKEVRAGRYTISASKGSYVGLSYGQARPLDVPKPLQILDNQTVERVDLSLPRGSVVTGRILDEFGEPISDVQVAPQRYQFIQGQRRLVPTGGMAMTDDLGEFRLFGVPPGQYYLTATWRNVNVSTEEKTTYAPMYYPGTDNPAQAQRVTLAVGQQLSDIVMTLKPIRATRISGTATTADGRPMSGSIMAMSTSGFGNMAGGGPIRPDGTFVLNGIAPGEYTLRAQSFGPAGPDAETAMAKITATGEDISDLRLVAAKPSVIAGRLIADPAAGAALPPGITLMAAPMDPASMMFGLMPARVTDDGSFELKAPPGKTRISVMNQSGGWTIHAIRLNGTDIIDTGLELRPNEDVSGVEVEMTNRLTTVSGLVTNARGEAVKDYSVIAFSQDREKWKAQNRYQGLGRPDQDGRFKISTLPPSDYYIIALDTVDPGQMSDPEFLDAIRTKATAITIREGETRTVDLKINTPS